MDLEKWTIESEIENSSWWIFQNERSQWFTQFMMKMKKYSMNIEFWIPSPSSNWESSLFQHSILRNINQFRKLMWVSLHHASMIESPSSTWLLLVIHCFILENSSDHVRYAMTYDLHRVTSLLAISERFSDRTGYIVRSVPLTLRGAARSTDSRDLAICTGSSDVVPWFGCSGMKPWITSNKSVEDGDSIIDMWDKETRMNFVNWFISGNWMLKSRTLRIRARRRYHHGRPWPNFLID
jgi:hypothetical protein